MSASQTPPEQAVQSLAVIPSVTAAYGHLFSNLRAVPAAIFLPVVIYLFWYAFVSFSGAGGLMPGPEQAAGQTPQVPAARFMLLLLVAFLVNFFATSLLYVAWHRLVLLGPVDGRPKFLYPIARRHLRYFGTLLLVMTIIFFAVLLLGVITRVILPPAGTMFFVVVAYFALAVKFSFVFPTISVDEAYGLGNAWKQSNGQELRLFAGFFLCFLPALVLSLMVNWSALNQLFTTGQIQVTPTSFWLDAFVTLFGVLNGLAVISYLSIAFKTCTGWVPAVPDRQVVQPWDS